MFMLKSGGWRRWADALEAYMNEVAVDTGRQLGAIR